MKLDYGNGLLPKGKRDEKSKSAKEQMSRADEFLLSVDEILKENLE